MICRVLVVAVVVGCSACGGGKSSTPDASHDARTAEANCFDGIDDNGDGLADCADPTCATVATCVAEVPADWTGYDHLFDGAGTQPTCAAMFTQTLTPGHSGLIANAATCGPCLCGPPANQRCDLADTVVVQDATCGNTPTDTTPLAVPAAWDGTCTGADAAPAGQSVCGANGTSPCNVSVTAGPAAVTGGACGASGGSASVPPSTFSGTGVACEGAPRGGGCTGTDVCQPKPAAPFESGICIHHDGDLACPAGPFTAKHVFFAAVDDTRGCSACGCGTPTGATCSATISVYASQGACAGSPVATFAAGDCANLTANPQVGGRKATITAPAGGTCSPSGGMPSGTATGTGATTYCCIP